MDNPARVAAPEAIIRWQNDPIPAASPATIDEAELEEEAAQKSGLDGRSRLSLGGLVWTGLAACLAGLGLSATDLIEGLFARSEWLGIIGVVFGVVFLVGLIGLAAREILAVASPDADRRNARGLGQRACGRRWRRRAPPGRPAGRALSQPAGDGASAAQVEEATRAIIDGRDLIDVTERALLRPLDDKAQGEIAAAAKRVSLVTAISPRAILDVLFVVAQIVRLVRRIAEIYGGRPGLLGLIKLARSIGAHIAITGGMAVGDSVLQQVVGHGIASRISARMGEGLLNGMLTTRVGLSALAVCRPMPFAVDKAPGVSEVAPFLFSKGE